jgi:hypothetical protein
VPAPYLTPSWWRRPKLLPEPNLTRWLAARVARVDADAVEFDVADITPGDRPVYGALELSLETIAAWWRGPGELSTLQPGEFIEFGFYGPDGRTSTIAVRHAPMRWPDLVRPSLDLDRYLQPAA